MSIEIDTEGALDLIITIQEQHTVSYWREEDNGKWGCWWQTVYNIYDGQLESVHRYVNGIRQGLTEVYDAGHKVCEVVYIGGIYKRMKMYNRGTGPNSEVAIWADALGRSIVVTSLCAEDE